MPKEKASNDSPKAKKAVEKSARTPVKKSAKKAPASKKASLKPWLTPTSPAASQIPSFLPKLWKACLLSPSHPQPCGSDSPSR
jgi:hypothetical protein